MQLVAQCVDKLYWLVLIAQLPSMIFHNIPNSLLVPSLEFRPIASILMFSMLRQEKLGSIFWEEKEDLKKNKIQFKSCLLNSLIKSGIQSYFFTNLLFHQFCLIPLLFKIHLNYIYITWNCNNNFVISAFYSLSLKIFGFKYDYQMKFCSVFLLRYLLETIL